MRIFHAGVFGMGETDGRLRAERALAEAGCCNRLLTFAEREQEQRVAFDVLIERRTKEAMRLYFAGNVMGPNSNEDDHAHGVRNRLLSFADADDMAKTALEFWITHPANVFLDSGAFGAHMRGVVIDLDRYCDYITEHHAALDCYAALDVIKDWRASAVNLDKMLAKGLRPVPCFHKGSPLSELDRLAREHKHIAIGGLVGTGKSLGRPALAPYLDEVWSCLEKHWPIKVHVFGVIAQWVLERYPFYSADSASAIVSAGMGRVMRFTDIHAVATDVLSGPEEECETQRFGGADAGGRLLSIDWRDQGRHYRDGMVLDDFSPHAVSNGSAHPGRRVGNIRAVLALEKYVTDAWAMKGITWS